MRHGRQCVRSIAKLYCVQQSLAIFIRTTGGVHSSVWQVMIVGFFSQYCANLCLAYSM